MSDRTDFEEWYLQERPDMVNPFERVVSDERYASMETEWAYRGYKVDTAEADKLVDEMVDALQRAAGKIEELQWDYNTNIGEDVLKTVDKAIKHYQEGFK